MPEEFHIRLRRLRGEAGLTQTQMADALVIGRSYYNRIEKGAREPSPRLVQQVNLIERHGVHLLHTDALKSEHNMNRRVRDVLREDEASYHPADSTERECRQYFDRYIRRATRIPGALGHALVQMKLHLKLSDLDELEKGQK